MPKCQKHVLTHTFILLSPIMIYDLFEMSQKFANNLSKLNNSLALGLFNFVLLLIE